MYTKKQFKRLVRYLSEDECSMWHDYLEQDEAEFKELENSYKTNMERIKREKGDRYVDSETQKKNNPKLQEALSLFKSSKSNLIKPKLIEDKHVKAYATAINKHGQVKENPFIRHQFVK